MGTLASMAMACEAMAESPHGLCRTIYGQDLSDRRRRALQVGRGNRNAIDDSWKNNNGVAMIVWSLRPTGTTCN